MSEDERNDVHDVIEQINQARWDRSDAAWRPFEEKWAALLAARDTADEAVCEGTAAVGTPTAEQSGPPPDSTFHTMAREAARVAHKEDFESRWGLRVLEGAFEGYDVCVLSNNNPYAKKLIRRDRELKEFRRWIAAHPRTVAELAYAEYPDRGAGEGFSCALLIQCDPGWTDDVEKQYQAARNRSWDAMSRSGDDRPPPPMTCEPRRAGRGTGSPSHRTGRPAEGSPDRRSGFGERTVASRGGRVRQLFLPPHCPESNPTKYRNNAVKGSRGSDGPATNSGCAGGCGCAR